MDFDQFSERLKDAMSRNETVTFFCSCEIVYSGRAEAFLPLGDRLIIVKSDNSLIVHQPNGGTPVNYMKNDTRIDINRKKNHIQLETRNGKDHLDIEIFRIHDYMSHKLEDGMKLQLAGNERDMSDMVYNNPSLIAPDFKPLSREEHNKFGFIDVFGHNSNGELVVVECKRYSAGLACVTQLRRYVEKIKELKGIEKVNGIMAAPKITSNANAMLEQWGFGFVSLKPPKYLERHDKKQTSLDRF